MPFETLCYAGGIVLSVFGSAVTIYKYWVGSRKNSTSEGHQETHSESINITLNTGSTEVSSPANEPQTNRIWQTQSASWSPDQLLL